jgi:hypothetical protein
MGTKFLEVMCDELGIGSSGEYCRDNDAHFDRINVFYQETMGGKYDADNLVNHMCGKNGAKATATVLSTDSPL